MFRCSEAKVFFESFNGNFFPSNPNFESLSPSLSLSGAFRRITLQPDNKVQLTEIAARYPNLWEQDFVSRSISDFLRSISNFDDVLSIPY